MSLISLIRKYIPNLLIDNSVIVENYEPKTYDLTNNYWGHGYSITGLNNEGKGISLFVWIPFELYVSDYLLLKTANGSTRYQIQTLHHYDDPSDQYKITATFAPRSK